MSEITSHTAVTLIAARVASRSARACEDTTLGAFSGVVLGVGLKGAQARGAAGTSSDRARAVASPQAARSTP